MTNPIEQYLDEVMGHAALAPADAARIRAELRDHLHEMFDRQSNSTIHPEEALAMMSEEFGDPRSLGKQIGGAKGRFRTFMKKRGRRGVVAIAVLIIAFVVIRARVAEAFYVVGDSVAPQLPAASRCLVYKLAANFNAGDVIVYIPQDRPRSRFLGIVTGLDPSTGNILIQRHATEQINVPRANIVGKVIANTR